MHGLPSNSTVFRNFAEEMGFKHHIVTPGHPRGNGEAEGLIKVLKKTEQKAEGRSSSSALHYMLMDNRLTPHPATGYCPYEVFMEISVGIKLDYDPFFISGNYHNMDREITNTDKERDMRKWDNQLRHSKSWDASIKDS